MDKARDIAVWAEYGLPGLIAGAMLLMFWSMLKQGREERKETDASHKAERKEWREDATKRDEKLVDALGALERAVRDQSLRKRG